jgi:hypothetical protein
MVDPIPKNRGLHFIVRDEDYEQYVGYGYFLDDVLKRLNNDPPQDVMKLMETTALYLLNPPLKRGKSRPSTDYSDYDILKSDHPLFREGNPKDWSYMLACLPSTFEVPKVLADVITAFRGAFRHLSESDRRSAARDIFGPASDGTFGRLNSVSLSDNRRQALHTVILDQNLAQMKETYRYSRGYFKLLCKQYGLKKNSDPPLHFFLGFSYPIPESNHRLQLMEIGAPLLLGFRSISSKLVFRHPLCNEAYMQDLVKCLTPLWKTLFDDQSPKSGYLPKEKLEALATVYWLISQSTPIERGGSAFANVILEHLTARLKKQGYDCAMPYMAEGVDLWAQASMLPLENVNTPVPDIDKPFPAPTDGDKIDTLRAHNIPSDMNGKVIEGFKARFIRSFQIAKHPDASAAPQLGTQYLLFDSSPDVENEVSDFFHRRLNEQQAARGSHPQL